MNDNKKKNKIRLQKYAERRADPGKFQKQKMPKLRKKKKIIHERLMAKYLVAGFVTVTTFSVIVAGIFVKFI